MNYYFRRTQTIDILDSQCCVDDVDDLTWKKKKKKRLINCSVDVLISNINIFFFY